MILCPRPWGQLAMSGEQIRLSLLEVGGEASLASSGKRPGILVSIQQRRTALRPEVDAHLHPTVNL